MRLGLILAALLLFATQAATAQECPRGASRWTDTELGVWRALCAGATADITPPYGGMEPPQAGQPSPENLLTAAFLRTILTEQPYSTAIQSVHIVGALVVGVLDLTGAAVRHDVVFEESHFLDGIVLDDMQAAGTWAFLHCYVPAALSARRARVQGGFSLARSYIVNGADLSGLSVGGDVVLRNLATRGILAANLAAGASLHLEGIAAANGELLLPGATIGVDATIVPDSALTALDLQGATIGGTLTLGRLTWAGRPRLDLTGTKVAALVTGGALPADTGMAYGAMAAALAAGGNPTAAAAVLRSGLEQERAAGPLGRRLWLTLRKWTTDYGAPGGYARLAALAIAAGLIAGARLRRKRS